MKFCCGMCSKEGSARVMCMLCTDCGKAQLSDWLLANPTASSAQIEEAKVNARRGDASDADWQTVMARRASQTSADAKSKKRERDSTEEAKRKRAERASAEEAKRKRAERESTEEDRSKKRERDSTKKRAMVSSRLALKSKSEELRSGQTMGQAWQEAVGIAAEVSSHIGSLDQKDLVVYTGITCGADYNKGSLFEKNGPFAHLPKPSGCRREELRSFLSGDVVQNPNHQTGRFGVAQCQKLLGLKSKPWTCSTPLVRKLTEFIVHNEHFKPGGMGSLAYLATAPDFESAEWEAKVTVCKISAGDADQDDDTCVFFVTHSNLIPQCVREGTARILMRTGNPPTPFDLEGMVGAVCDPRDRATRDEYRAEEEEEEEEEEDLEPATGTALFEQLEPSDGTREPGNLFFWEARVDSEPRAAANGRKAWVLTIMHGRGARDEARTHVQSCTYLTPTLDGALAEAAKRTATHLGHGSVKGQSVKGRMYQRVPVEHRR